MAAPEPCWSCSAGAEGGAGGFQLTGGAAVCAGQRGAPPSLRYFHLGGQRRLRFGDGAPALAGSFTLCLWLRRGDAAEAVGSDDADLILHGTDDSAWFAVLRDGNRAAVVHHKHGALIGGLAVDDRDFGWFAVRGDSHQTELLGGHDSVEPLGSSPWSLAGSKLRLAGWSKRTYDLASVHLWDTCLSDEELWDVFTGSAQLHGVKPKARGPVEPPAAPPPPASKPQLRGRVVDCNGDGLFGVSLSRPSTASTTYTDGDGLFELELEEDEEEGQEQLDALVLSFTREGYAPCQVEVDGLAVGEVQMVALSHTATLASAEGGTVVDPSSGASVKILAGSLTYPDGSPFEGTAHMSLAVIDVTSEASLAGMPGDFTAHGVDGADQQLQSMGAIFVGITDEEGRDLHAKGGGGMELSLQSSASLNLEEVQDVPSVYAFDEGTGKWQQVSTPLCVDGKALPAPGAASGGEVATKKKKKGKKKQPEGEVDAEEDEEEEEEEEEEENEVERKFQRKGKMGFKKYKKGAGLFQRKKEKVWKAEDFGALFTGSKRREFVMTGIERPGWYNADVPYMPFLVTGELGKEGAGAVVWCIGKSYPGRSRANADELGGFGVVAQQRAEVVVRVAYPPSEGWAEGSEELIATDPKAAGTENVVEFGPYRMDPGPTGRMRELGRLFRGHGKQRNAMSAS